MWKVCFYKRIEEFRKRIRKVAAAVSTADCKYVQWVDRLRVMTDAYYIVAHASEYTAPISHTASGDERGRRVMMVVMGLYLFSPTVSLFLLVDGISLLDDGVGLVC